MEQRPNYTLGIEAGMSEFMKNVSLSIYYRRYAVDEHSQLDKNLIGARVEWEMKRDLYWALRFERAGILDGISTTLSYKF